ncbi:MAG: glycine cleavage system aminomethyltransferase GcvT [bacterium]|nr:glycine cleavage system aminomethyltransferase GcvT [bacterium]
MTQPNRLDPRRTPLHDCHQEAGAKLVEFAGWEMPVRYRSEVEEHRTVRNAAGLFDVSHMGEIRVRGGGALELLQRLTPNDVTKLRPGRAHYSGLLTEQATYIDDLLVYQLAEDDYLLVVNASNTDEDLRWILSQPRQDCEIEDTTLDYALLALQGPKACDILARHTDADFAALRYYRFVEGEVAGSECLISRTGYTGEDGFELFLPPAEAPGVWRELLASGAGDGLIPTGLAARDTLRLEAGMALYGHEIDATTTPYEAGLNWVVKLKKGDFIGREVLVGQREKGVERRLVGFEIRGRGIARQGNAVLHEGREVGAVTSGTWSPTFERGIGTAYMPTELAAEGARLEIAVRKRRLEAVVVKLPFYRRS